MVPARLVKHKISAFHLQKEAGIGKIRVYLLAILGNPSSKGIRN